MGCSDSQQAVVDHEGTIILIQYRQSSNEQKMHCIAKPTKFLNIKIHWLKTIILKLPIHISRQTDPRLNKQKNPLFEDNNGEFS